MSPPSHRRTDGRWSINIPSIGTILGFDSPSTSIPSLMQSRGAAGEQDNKGAEEQAHHGHEEGPDSSGEHGVVASAIAVDLILDDAPGDEISDHDNQGHDPGEGGDEGCEDGAAPAGTESEQERDEGDSAGNRVQDLNSGKAVSGVLCGATVVVDAVDGFHDQNRRVADRVRGTPVIGLVNTVPKGTEADGGAIGEGNLEKSDAVHGGGTDGGDQEEDGGGEEEECADVVKEAGGCHY